MTGNPVLKRELMLRSRLRQSRRASVVFTACCLLILGWIYVDGALNILGANRPSAGAIGWTILVWAQFILILLIVPAITANAIAKEKEQQTWELLLFSRLGAAEIVFGKLLPRLAAVGLLLLADLPLAALGISTASTGGPDVQIPWVVVWNVYGATLIIALLVASLTLYLSWALSRTLHALVVSYAIIFGGLIIGTALATQLISMLTGSSFIWESCPLVWLNPIVLLYTAGSSSFSGPTPDRLYEVLGLSAYLLVSSVLIARMTLGLREFSRG